MSQPIWWSDFERLWANGSSPDLDAFLIQRRRCRHRLNFPGWLVLIRRSDGSAATGARPRNTSIAIRHSKRITDSAVDLIYHEYLLREKLAERPSLDEFTNRFPQHAAVLAEQVGLHRALADASDNVQHPKYRQARKRLLRCSSGDRIATEDAGAIRPISRPRAPGPGRAWVLSTWRRIRSSDGRWPSSCRAGSR